MTQAAPPQDDRLDRLARWLVALTMLVLAAGMVLVGREMLDGLALAVAVALAAALLAAGLAALRDVLWPAGAFLLLAAGAGIAAGVTGPFPLRSLLGAALLMIPVAWVVLRRRRAYRSHRVRLVTALAACVALGITSADGVWDIASAMLVDRRWDGMAISEGAFIGTPSFQTADGGTITLDSPDRLYVLDFIVPGCAPCLEELPHLAELQRRLQERDDAELLLVLPPVRDEDLALLHRHAPDARFVFDKAQWGTKELGIHSYPTKLFVRRGHVLDAIRGARSTGSVRHVERRIAKWVSTPP